MSGETVSYSGSAEWSYRRFILHYARLCAVAGGVDAFCIGSEMRSLTQIRGSGDSFPSVSAFRQLAADVRLILGPGVKISYAADWSEYFGYHTGSNVYFHLDPLWADANIDFVGIDNYMPISDWRDGGEHADSSWGSIYDLAYLASNVAGGEGFDWYYDSPEGALAQRRLPIQDAAYDEPWVFRYKDLRSWWSNLHHDRIEGVRSSVPSPWVPGSKPFRFTEYGCAAIDKGSNEPNRFIDVRSSESGLPAWSNGRRDDLIQMQYLLAVQTYWSDPANNPTSSLYGAQMIAMDRAHAWAWDARPFPEFPGQTDVWNDGANYVRGHWLNGRATNQPLSAVATEICEQSGGVAPDVSNLFGLVRGYQQSDIATARSTLQPLMLAYGFDAVEREGRLILRNRDARKAAELTSDDLATAADVSGPFETTRLSDAETSGQVRLGYVDAQSSYDVRAVETRFPDEEAVGVSQTDLPLVLTKAEAMSTVERWLSEARVARDTARFALPKSRLSIGAGDVVGYSGSLYRIDRVEQTEGQTLEAVRVEPGVYSPSDRSEEISSLRPFTPPVPVVPVFLDLPLLTGDEVAHAPHVAIGAEPWPGSVAIWSSAEDAGYVLNKLVAAPSVIGVTETALAAHPPGLWDRGEPLRIKLGGSELASATLQAVLNGANAMAVGDGSGANWEVFQFAEAQLVAPETYELSVRLRGQLGTDGIMPPVWPAGSTVVLLDLSLTQIDLALSARGLARYYRIGIASRGYEDVNATLRIEAFDGIGLRPYPIAHLRMTAQSGDMQFAWKRRTRLDGDSWQASEVPLGEETEAYQVRIVVASAIVAEYAVAQPQFQYTSAMRSLDGVTGAFQVKVAQVSARFGPGPDRAIDVAA